MNKSIIVTVAALLACGFITGCGSNSIDTVQKGTLNYAPDVTIEDGYKYALKSPKWRSYRSDRGKDVVEVSGRAKADEVTEFVLMTALETLDQNTYTEEEEHIYSHYRVEGYDSPIRYRFGYDVLKINDGDLDNFVRENLRKFNRVLDDAIKAGETAERRKASVYQSMRERGMDTPDNHFKNKLDEIETDLKRFEAAKKEVESYIKKTQKALEKDVAKAQKARHKFLKRHYNDTKIYVTAQFFTHKNDSGFTSGPVKVALKGGPLDGAELDFDVDAWNVVLFTD